MVSSFCREKAKTSSSVSGSSPALQMPVETRSLRPSDKATASFRTSRTDRAALELAPSVRRPPITAAAMPSKPTCSGVFPVMSSMPPSDATLSRTSSAPPAAAIFWSTSNPVAAVAPGSTKGLDTCMASFGGPSLFPSGRSNGFMDTRNPPSRVCTAGPMPRPKSGTTGGVVTAFLAGDAGSDLGVKGSLSFFLSPTPSASSFLRNSTVTISSSASRRCC
uniref:Uncharacterized protein n=1 Tax=Zea mays TaxID=4577 RepID=C4J2D9_MAIZE|nr:unknown [Zea mays]ACR36656.1 unknown [Zea mays]